jgi:hypothetical protein
MRSQPRVLSPILLTVVVAVAAACTGASAPTPIPETPVPVAAEAAAAPGSSSGDAANAAAPASASAPAASASMNPALATMTPNKALEARIPAAVGDLELKIVSLNGAEYLARTTDPTLAQLIAASNLEPPQVSVAVGIAQETDQQLAIAAFKFPGVDEQKLERMFVDALEVGTTGVKVHDTTVRGHHALFLEDPGGVMPPTYLNVEGDTARVVQATGAALAKDAMTALP